MLSVEVSTDVPHYGIIDVRALADMLDLTSTQIAIIERLIGAGFTPVAFPMYASAVGIRRGTFAALLAPVPGGGLQVLGAPCYIIEGNLSVIVNRGGRKWFVWKKKQVEAPSELLADLGRFSAEVSEILQSIG